MRNAIAAMLCLLCTGLASCGDAHAPEVTNPPATAASAAKQALAEMTKLAEAGDWAVYVDRYYGEKEKLESAADRDALIKRFEDKWGPKLLEALKSAADIEPRIEGDRAMFEKDGAPIFTLYRTADGGWGFHL